MQDKPILSASTYLEGRKITQNWPILLKKEIKEEYCIYGTEIFIAFKTQLTDVNDEHF